MCKVGVETRHDEGKGEGGEGAALFDAGGGAKGARLGVCGQLDAGVVGG